MKAKAKAKPKAKTSSKAKAKAKAKPGTKAKPRTKAKPVAKAKPGTKAKTGAKPKVLELFKAYKDGQLPGDGGYIISSFLADTSTYSRYEVVAYSGVKTIVLTEEGLTFQSDGNKMFILAEPASYPQKATEPFRRSAHEHFPHRFSELDIITARNQTKVMVSKTPLLTYGSFTVLKPTGNNFAFIFYNLPDVMETMATFFATTLNNDAGVPKVDAEKTSRLVLEGIMKFTIWNK